MARQDILNPACHNVASVNSTIRATEKSRPAITRDRECRDQPRYAKRSFHPPRPGVKHMNDAARTLSRILIITPKRCIACDDQLARPGECRAFRESVRAGKSLHVLSALRFPQVQRSADGVNNHAKRQVHMPHHRDQ